MENNSKVETILSLKNHKVKSWAKLKQKKGRTEQGLYLIEGQKILSDAIHSGLEIESILIEEGKEIPDHVMEYLIHHKTQLFYLSPSVTEALADTEQSQGYFAVIKQQTFTIQQLIEKQPLFLLILDQIQDPGNLGTIIRSADAAGIDGIIIGTGTVDVFNPKVVRSAMGSIFHVPVVVGDLEHLLFTLKQIGFKIVGTSPYANKSYFHYDFLQRTAIIVGNEANGLSKEREKSVDEMIAIPMNGQAESLNVAMATTLVLYERLRQNQ